MRRLLRLALVRHNLLRLQKFDQHVDRFIYTLDRRRNPDFRIGWYFVGSRDPGELRDDTFTSFPVEPFGVALFTNLQRTIQKNLNKIPLIEEATGEIAIFSIGRNECNNGYQTGVGKKFRNMTDSANVLFSVFRGKTQVCLAANPTALLSRRAAGGPG